MNKPPKVFHLERKVDVSGVSGIGVVAYGVEFSDGICVIHWNSDTASTAIYLSVNDLMHVHSHSGGTEIVYHE